MKKIILLLLLCLPIVLADSELVNLNTNIMTIEEINTTANVTTTTTDSGITMVSNETKIEIIPIRIGNKVIRLPLNFTANINREIAIEKESETIISPTNASILNVTYTSATKELVFNLNGTEEQEIIVYSPEAPKTVKRNGVKINFSYEDSLIKFLLQFSTPQVTINFPIPITLSPSNGGGGGGGSANSGRCKPIWDCTPYMACSDDGFRRRECKSVNNCYLFRPELKLDCQMTSGALIPPDNLPPDAPKPFDDIIEEDIPLPFDDEEEVLKEEDWKSPTGLIIVMIVVIVGLAIYFYFLPKAEKKEEEEKEKQEKNE